MAGAASEEPETKAGAEKHGEGGAHAGEHDESGEAHEEHGDKHEEGVVELSPEALTALLEGGGFTNVHAEEIEVVFEYSSPEEFVTSSLELAPPLTALLAQYPPTVQDETREAMTEAARAHAAGDGALTLSNKALLASGEA